ncbi:siderophore-interacting protein [Paractinoplanes rishiriensis]|uniref:Siderophore-interacting protein n=1 Tax=Paractinoplanes rishiriensis TaxID=1050105 RepID=A0A919MXA5_9ACTN|nr:siderophore-interacting protein [Actinoplanes rishiriensis]GIE95510.1 siderophore-interacting protein [Actinoplanes rishiriensis]
MARSNLHATRIKPEQTELLVLRVLRSERISPGFQRVTLGEGDVGKFRPMGFDQWFRLFIPVADGSLDRLPNKLNTLAFLRFLAIAKATRPLLRSYTVRAARDGSFDVDFVLHEPAGPAAEWAVKCAPGDTVAILDEGIGFHPPDFVDRIRLVGEESALPAIAGILGSLDAGVRGEAIIEIPAEADRQDLTAPAGVSVTWVVRQDHAAVPGVAALAAAVALSPAPGMYGWVAGEQALASGLRRHWVATGVPKENIMFCGYWRHT